MVVPFAESGTVSIPLFHDKNEQYPMQLFYEGRRLRIMPNIKSAKKRVRVNQTKAAANKARKSNLKTMVKKAEAACNTNATDKEAAIRVAIKKVDQACAKGLMHKNAAARKKSQLAKKLNASK